MNLLLDTHAVIWFITEDKQLPNSLKLLIEDSTNNCFVSVVSLWEISIKYSLGKLDLNAELNQIFELIEKSGFSFLYALPTHILYSASLPFHHRDPFDRLIIAQAKTENLVLLSRDKEFKSYDIDLLWK